MTDFEETFEDALEAVDEAHFDRDRFVPGVGPLDAAVALVGEAPGGTEVKRGEPFVGRAGRRLDEVLDALGVDRSELYVTNVVKVRPPNNRTPTAAELAAWRDVLDAELARVDPSVVIPLGATAARVVLDTDASIGELHGRRFERSGRVVVPAYHPAATLYDPSKRAPLESDLAAAFEEVR